MSRCIAYDVVDGKGRRCDNIVANVSMKVCSNPKCQRMGSSMIESDRSVIAALFNIMGDDVDNVWLGSKADELGSVIEASSMLRGIDPVVNFEHDFGMISGAANVVDPCCHPSPLMVRMHSTSKDASS
jgi:hypothetical protein